MRLLLKSLLYDLVFYERCSVCNQDAHYKYSPFCEACWNKIKGFSSPKILKGKFCDNFWKYITSLNSFGPYEGILKEAIHVFKYNGIKRIGKELGKLLALIPPPKIDFLIPVPLHINKLRKREFNQAAILAKIYADTWKIPLKLTLLVKIKDTKDQASLEAKQRQTNVKGAYEAKGLLTRANIGLVDDVVTTGATLIECAKVLKKAGANQIHAITLARTF